MNNVDKINKYKMLNIILSKFFKIIISKCLIILKNYFCKNNT